MKKEIKVNFEEINILGDIINDSWGYGSTNNYEREEENMYGSGMTKFGQGQPSSVAIKASLQGDNMTVMSLAIINLGDIGSQHKEITKAENELNQHIDKYISKIKKEFKMKENAGRALKCKQIKDSEKTDVEMINHYAANRRAYVRRSVVYEVS